jgi:MYXO-CTERM domain-containing protein
VASPMIKVEVADRSTLNASGALQVCITVPLLLGGLALAAHLRNRRRV